VVKELTPQYFCLQYVQCNIPANSTHLASQALIPYLSLLGGSSSSSSTHGASSAGQQHGRVQI
jgi:hypothetical protein